MFLVSNLGFDWGNILRILFLIGAGIPLVRFVTKFLGSLCDKRFTQHMCVLMRKVIFYGGLAFIGANVLNELGFNLAALLGAAGIFGVAIGFASQTSISNIISGIFLLLEQPFSIGDTIKCSDITGAVETIDLLSVKVRTFDGKLVRLPNEMVLKQRVINNTHYPARRIDLIVSVPYGENTEKVIDLIAQAVKSDPLVLDKPEAVILADEIVRYELSKESFFAFQVRAWADKSAFVTTRSSLVKTLKSVFDKNEISIIISKAN